jgi:hypothetical protein
VTEDVFEPHEPISTCRKQSRNHCVCQRRQLDSNRFVSIAILLFDRSQPRLIQRLPESDPNHFVGRCARTSVGSDTAGDAPRYRPFLRPAFGSSLADLRAQPTFRAIDFSRHRDVGE